MTTRTVVRAPNHLGDVVLALPALAAAGGDIVVVEPLAPVVAMMDDLPGEVIPYRRGVRGFWRAAAHLRRRGYDRGALLTRSLGAALLFAVAGVGRQRGTATDGRSVLLREAVDPDELRGRHRALRYLHLVGRPAEGPPPAPRLDVPPRETRRWRRRLADGGEGEGGRRRSVVGLVPGSRAPSRRWDPSRFAAVGSALSGDGAAVAVFGAPDEEALTRRVAGGVPGAVDVGGETTLPELAAALAACDLVVSNDTGPMHLAAAVETPTVALFGAGDPGETGVLGTGHTVLAHAELFCVPCVENECPRSGEGAILADAHEECMALITVEEVVAAARHTLAGGAESTVPGREA